MSKPSIVLVFGMLLWSQGGCSSSVGVGSDADVSADAVTMNDGGTSCQSGWEPAFGVPFDASTSCVDLGATTPRIVVGCIPLERSLLGQVTCYAQNGGTLRVVTNDAYPWITNQGWSVCSGSDSAPPGCQ